MRNVMGAITVAAVLAGMVAGAACGTTAPPARQAIRTIAERQPAATDNVVVDWNAVARRATAAAPVDPPRESRTLAMVHGAVLDALQTLDGRDASPVAAVAVAAHDVLVAVYPPQQASLDESERATLAAVPDGPQEDAGAAAGRRAAQRVLDRRATDHADEKATYTPEPRPGEWRPTPPAQAPALDAGWGAVTPFVLDRPSQFRPGPP